MNLFANLPRYIFVFMLLAASADHAPTMSGVREQTHDQVDIDDRPFDKKAETYASDNNDRRVNSIGTRWISDGASGTSKIDPGLVVSSGEDFVRIVNTTMSTHIFFLASGSYAGGTIKRNGVTIVADRGRTTVTSPLVIRANNVTLDGLTWRGVNGTNVSIYGKNNVIRNCSIIEFGKDAASKGIWIRPGGDYSNNVIEGCVFDDWGSPAHHSSGIKIGQSGTAPTSSNNVIRGNRFTNGASGGNSPAIQIFFPSIVEDNVIDGCEDGIEVKGSNNIIRHNMITNCDGGEILSNRFGNNNLYEGNCIVRNAGFGLTVSIGVNNTWSNNVIYDNERIAHITSSGDKTGSIKNLWFDGNIFVGNNQRGVSFNEREISVADVIFTNNIFSGPGRVEKVQYVRESSNNHFDGFAPFGTAYSQGPISSTLLSEKLRQCPS